MKSDTVRTFVIFLLLLQVVAVACLWILNVLSTDTTGVFAILLAADLIAFATVVQFYRNPGTVERTQGGDKNDASGAQPSSPPPAAQGAQSQSPAPAGPSQAPAKTMAVAETRDQVNVQGGYVGKALPHVIHLGVPVVSFFVVLVFAVVTFLPGYKGTLPEESTIYFIPIYLTIVVILVFASMYLFKRLMDAEGEYEAHRT